MRAWCAWLLGGIVTVVAGCGGKSSDGRDGPYDPCEHSGGPTIVTVAAPTEVAVNGMFDFRVNVAHDSPEVDDMTATLELLAGAMTFNDQSLPVTVPIGEGVLFGQARVTSAAGAQVRVVITDACGDSDQTTVEFAIMNFAPYSSGSGASSSTLTRSETVTVWASFTDQDGDPLTYTHAVMPSAAGTLSGTDDGDPESFVFTPSSSFLGDLDITVSVDDGHSHTAQATIDLTVVNQAPVFTSATAVSAMTTYRGGVVTVTASANDPDGDALEYEWLLAGSAGGSLSVTPDTWGSEASITWTASASQLGTADVTVHVRDALGAEISQAAPTVTVVNRAPTITSFTADAESVAKNGSATLTLVTDDLDGDSLTIGYVLTGVGSITDSTTETETWTAPDGYGSATVEVTVTDPFSDQATDSVTFHSGVWTNLGTPGFTSSEGGVIALEIDSNDDFIVAYDPTIDIWPAPQTGQMVARKYEPIGGAWDLLGAQVSGDPPIFADMVLLNDLPVISYQTGGLGGPVWVYAWTGAAWSAVSGTSVGGGFGDTSLAVDSNDTLFIAYRSSGGTGAVAVEAYGGSSWAYTPDASGADIGGVDGWGIHIAVNEADEPIVIYADLDDGSGDHPLYAKRLTGGSWQFMGSQPLVGGFVLWAALASGGSGTYAVGEGVGELEVLEWDDTGGDWVALPPIPGWSPAQIHIIDSGTEPWVSYNDDYTMHTVRYDRGRDAWDEVGAPRNIATLNGFPEIAFDSSGRAYRAFYDATNGGVSVETVD